MRYLSSIQGWAIFKMFKANREVSKTFIFIVDIVFQILRPLTNWTSRKVSRL